jgi:hypothetical protein
MAGYTRTDTTNNIADGNIINATDLDNEFDGIQAAFNSSTGHNHDGTTGEGAPILVLGPTQDVVVGAAAVTPKTTNTVDIGSSSLKFKDLWLAGNANFAGTTTLGGALTYGGVTLSNAVTGTGNMVLSASPTLTGTISGANASLSGTLAVTGVATLGNGAILGTPASVTLTNATGLPIASGVSGLGTGVATALAVNVGSAGAPVVNGGALGTPSSGTVTNLTGTASININGTVGATTASTGAFTTLTTSSTVTHNAGTANGVAYLNGSKVLTTGSALTFDGVRLGVGVATPLQRIHAAGNIGLNTGVQPGANGNGIAIYASDFPRLTFRNSTTGDADSDGLQIYMVGNDVSYDLVENGYQRWNLSGSEQMRLTSTGLGIGTSSPAYKLDVNGAVNSRQQGSSSNLAYKINNNGSWVQPNLIGHWYNAGPGKDMTRIAVASSLDANSAFLDFSADGDLGVAVTPSGWASNRTALQLGGFGTNLSSFNGSGGATNLSHNAFNDGSNWVRQLAFSSALYVMDGTGNHTWFTAGSGAAGSTISFTQAMTLEAASGNLGVGTTSPTYRLHVANGYVGILRQTGYGSSASIGIDLGAANADSVNGSAIYAWGQEVVGNASGQSLIFKSYRRNDTTVERARFDPNGNLLLGATSVGGSSASGMRLGDIATLSQDINSFYINAGAVGASTATYLKTGNPPVQIFLDSSQGTIKFQRAGAGTAGNAFGFAESARISTGGDILLSNGGSFYGLDQYTNKKMVKFEYPTTGFGAFSDCLDFATPGGGSGLVQARVTQGGNVGCRGSFSGGQTLNDYAEYFEWADGNPANEDRIGVTVVLDGEKIRPSTDQDDGADIFGVVSGTAGVVLGSSPFEWAGKYQKDEFGRIVTEKVTWVYWHDGLEHHNYKVGEVPDGVVVPASAEYRTYDNQVVVSGYDESAEYQSRDQRKEWAAIGLVGQVHVKAGQLVGDRWRKMKDVSSNVAIWLIR